MGWILLTLTPTALAYDPIPDTDRLCSLTVHSQHGGVTYDAYKVCQVDRMVRFTPWGRFADAPGIMRLIEAGEWQDLTTSLVTWLKGQASVGETVIPQGTVTTDETGEGVLEGLPQGLYLVVGRQYLTDAGYYEPVNFMICLPNWVEEDSPDYPGSEDGWVYDVSVQNKGSERNEEITARKAVKSWRGVGSQERPTEVTVQLLKTDRRTGETTVEGEITLNRRNNWQALWEELDNIHYEWTIQEIDVPGEYDVVYRQSGINVLIINYYDPDEPKNDPDDPPDDPDDPDDPDNPDNPDDPGVDPDPPPVGPPNIPSEDLDDPPPPLVNPPTDEEFLEDPDPDPNHDGDPDPEEEDIDDDRTPLARLPQTGVLWWPVPFLAMGGMLLFALGWGLNRRGRGDEE